MQTGVVLAGLTGRIFAGIQCAFAAALPAAGIGAGDHEITPLP